MIVVSHITTDGQKQMRHQAWKEYLTRLGCSTHCTKCGKCADDATFGKNYILFCAGNQYPITRKEFERYVVASK